MHEAFNLEDIFDQEVKPLLNQIRAICERAKMPMIAAFTVWADEEEHFNRCFENRFPDRRVPEFEEVIEGMPFE